MKDFRKGEGLLHSLIYDPKSKQLLEDLVTTSKSLKRVTAEIENGEGTIGALISDPSLYDSLNSLLGGAGRSFILRHVIRKSIEKGSNKEN